MSNTLSSAKKTAAWWDDPQAVRRHLRSLKPADLQKVASLGGDQEEGFEQAFASLAYSFVKDKAPRLLDFIIGFQLVDRNEDNTKAFGVFGFKVGDMWLYVPVFFLAGDMKGHELLYVKKQDMFVPLKENWVSYLISQRPHALGEPADVENMKSIGGALPNIANMVRMRYAKMSSDRSVSPWAAEFMPLACALLDKRASVLRNGETGEIDFAKLASNPAGYAIGNLAKKFDLRDLMSGSYQLFKSGYENHYLASPAVKRAFDVFYGEDFFHKLAEAMVLTRTSLSPRRRSEKTAQVAVYDRTNSQHLPMQDKEKIARDGVLVVDERADDTVNKAFENTTTTSLTSPTLSGLYKLFESTGEMTDALCLRAPVGPNSQANAVLIVNKDNKGWITAEISEVLCSAANAQDAEQDLRKYVDGLSEAGELKKDGQYMLLTPDGRATLPFRVMQDNGNGSYRVAWSDGIRRKRWFPHSPVIAGGYKRYDSWDAPLQIGGAAVGGRIHSRAGTVYVPKGAKVISLPDEEYTPHDHSGKDTPNPGDVDDLQAVMLKVASPLDLTEDSGEYRIFDGTEIRRLGKIAALRELVVRHNLREAAAREMLEKAAASGRKGCRFLVKKANVQIPDFPEPLMGAEQVSGPRDLPAIYSQEEYHPIDSMRPQELPQEMSDPYYRSDPGVMQMAQRAAASGQKEVFDTAMFSGMLKTVRSQSLVDKNLGNLMQALNSLGRLLFVFFWNGEEFADRYSKAELPELEDSLRNTFESLGDVCLFLKEKTVQSVSGIDLGAGAGVGNTSEPSIEAVSRI